MEHRIYNLDTKMKVLGLELGDIGVIVVTWYLIFLIVGAMLPDRARLVTAIAVTIVVYQVWIRVKDRVPSNFVPHLASWVAERSEYEVTPDLNPQPYLIDPDAVAEYHGEQRDLRRLNAQLRRRAKRMKGGN